MFISAGFKGKIQQYSQSQQAWRVLAIFSVLESTILPLPIDVLLAPMLCFHQQPWRLMSWAALWSVVGGCLGYALGWFLSTYYYMDILDSAYGQVYAQGLQWFQQWGILAVLVGAITPIPYKVISITAGMLQQPFALFLLLSLVGRGLRLSIWCFLKLSTKQEL